MNQPTTGVPKIFDATPHNAVAAILEMYVKILSDAQAKFEAHVKDIWGQYAAAAKQVEALTKENAELRAKLPPRAENIDAP